MHKQLLDGDKFERQTKYAEWVSKLNQLDYDKATRSFFAELNSKSQVKESFGSIRDEDGNLSTTFQATLENWALFTQNSIYIISSPTQMT